MYQDRVARGAKLLDARKPDWFRLVVLDWLSMDSCDDCILGQVYGHFLDGCVKLGNALMHREAVVEFGFDLPAAGRYALGPEALDRFEQLADAWRVEIRRRLEAGGPQRA